MTRTRLSTPPAQEPVTLAELLEVARELDGVSDDLLTGYIEGGREHAEAVTGRQLVEATRKLWLDDFTGDEIELPRPPLQSVTTVKYRDVDGDWQTLVEDTDYIVDTNGGGTSPEDLSGVGRIYLPKDTSWPDVYDEQLSVEITYVCGYPVTAGTATTPESIKNAVKLAAADLYDAVPFRRHIGWLLSRFRVEWRL